MGSAKTSAQAARRDDCRRASAHPPVALRKLAPGDRTRPTVHRTSSSAGGRQPRAKRQSPPQEGRSLSTTRRTALAALSPCLVAGAAARADALADIKSAGKIKVGVFADFPPFSSASADMSLKGYDMDVAQAIADGLGVKLNPVAVTGQNRIPYLTDKRVDLLMSVGYSDERAKVIDFAAAYAPYYIAVIGPAALKVEGKDDLAGKSIAVNRGTLEDTSLTEAAPASADIKRFDNYNAVIQAFISGQTQLMVVGNDVGAQVLARQEAPQAGAEVPADDLAVAYRPQQGRGPR